MSVILLAISGVAGVILTVWGRLIPPDTRYTKLGFVALGTVSVVCIIGAGIINSTSQSRLTRIIGTMAENVQKLSGPANIRSSANADQILSAAAEKLIQQDAEIQKLTSEMNAITKPADGFYENDVMVGRSVGSTQTKGNIMMFQLVVAGGNGLDFSRVFQYQDHSIKCEPPPVVGQSGSFGVMSTQYPNLRCTIER